MRKINLESLFDEIKNAMDPYEFNPETDEVTIQESEYAAFSQETLAAVVNFLKVNNSLEEEDEEEFEIGDLDDLDEEGGDYPFMGFYGEDEELE